MINAVIELGERRVHEVMVPRVAIAALRPTATFEEAIDLVIEDGHSRIPSTRRRSTRSSGSCTRRTCCRTSSPTPARARAPQAAAAAGARARVDDRSTTCSTSSSGARSTSRSCSTSTAARRAWSRSRTCSRRSSARSRTSTTSRSRWSCGCRDHEARVDGRADRSTSCSSCSTSTSSSRTPRSTTRSAASCTTASAACPSPGDDRGRRAAAHGRDDRRPAGRQGARRAVERPVDDEATATADGATQSCRDARRPPGPSRLGRDVGLRR